MSASEEKGVLVVGAGSIGRRHLRNLRTLGARPLFVFDPDESRSKATAQESGARAVARIENGLSRASAALICAPSHLHVSLATQAARSGVSVFIEKPLSDRLDGLDELEIEVASRGLFGMVGFNLRFHPAFRRMKSLLDEGAIGRALSCRLNAGQYLPDWHPNEDYRKNYSANRSMGGGILLDTHEFDYLTWLAGAEPERISCFAGKVSSLDLDTEDCAEVSFWLKNGMLANLHVDYLQRFYQRRYEFYGERGTLIWDSHLGLRCYDADAKRWKEFPEALNVDPNHSYLEEMKHFLACLRGEAKPFVDLARGRAVLEWTFAAKQSAENGAVWETPAKASR